MRVTSAAGLLRRGLQRRVDTASGSTPRPGALLMRLAMRCSLWFLFQGFFCQTEDDFNDWCQHVRKVGSVPRLWGKGKAASGVGSRLPWHLCQCPRVVIACGIGFVWGARVQTLLMSLGFWLIAVVRLRGGGTWNLPPRLLLSLTLAVRALVTHRCLRDGTACLSRGSRASRTGATAPSLSPVPSA